MILCFLLIMDAYVVHLGMLVTNNKLNDKCEVLHSWYKDMNNTFGITENQSVVDG